MGIRRLVAAAIVIVCIGMPLIESFDSWDHTLSDGNDTEINLIVVALCVGLALSSVTAIAFGAYDLLRADFRAACLPASVTLLGSNFLLRPLPTCSPPRVPLRI